MSDLSGREWKRGGGTGRQGRSESGSDDDDEALEVGGAMGMKEKVGLRPDCNTTPSSDWLIPLSHLLIVEDVVCPAEETSANKVSVAVMASRVCGASVDIPAIKTGSMLVVPAFMGSGGVSLPSTTGAPSQSSSSFMVPTQIGRAHV